MNIEQAEQIVSNFSTEMTTRLQENLGNKITPELANGFLLTIRHILSRELAEKINESQAQSSQAEQVDAAAENK